jgi:lipopolysaccharide heptosyltransferase II
MFDPASVRSIQVFHLNHIGDMVFSLPLLASLRRAFPKARIVSVLRPPVLGIWQLSGQAHEFLVREKKGSLATRMELVRALRKRDPDLTIVLSQAWEPTIMAWLSRSPVRVGFKKTKMGWLLTHRAKKSGPPSTENNLRLLEALGVTPARREYVGLLRAPLGETRRMSARLTAAGVPSHVRLIVLAPGASARRAVKEWTDEGWAAVADHFSAQPETAVAITGTEPAGRIIELARGPILDLTGRTSEGEWAALLDRADLFIGVDSGALHVAAALGTQVVGLYGPSDPNITGPQGLGHLVVRHPVDCSPCFRRTCSIGRVCMVNIEADAVIDAAERALADADALEPPGPDEFPALPREGPDSGA